MLLLQTKFYFLLASLINDGNMSYRWDSTEAVDQNRKRFLRNNKVRIKKWAEVNQVHSDKIIVIDNRRRPSFSTVSADGLATNRPVSLFIKTADCLPIFYYTDHRPAAVLLHAGSQGLDSRIHLKGIQLMQDKFKIPLTKIMVYIGPHIRRCCYQYDSFLLGTKKNWQFYLSKTKKNQLSCDLTSFTVNSLIKTGLKPKQVTASAICTACDGRFFSHYRSQQTGKKEGRFGVWAVA